MEAALQALIDHTQASCGLEDYVLKRHHIFHSAQEGYLFSTEWFPANTESDDSGSNPPGTAVVHIDFHSKALKSLVFVKEQSFAKEGTLPGNVKDQLLDWIEEETDMMYGRQFQLASETAHTLHFRASIDHMPVAPSGTIDVKFNDQGQLVLFSIKGIFPDETKIDWEPFALTAEATEPIANNACTLVDVPVEKAEAWIPCYQINPVFVTNDGKTVFSAEDVNQYPVYIPKDEILSWEGHASGILQKRKINLDDTVTFEQALAAKAHPDIAPIRAELEAVYKAEVTRVMQLEYPNESGQWKLTALYREHGHVIAIVHPTEDRSALKHRIKIIMDPEGDEVNMVDNKFLFQLLANFKPAEPAKLSTEAAYQLLKPHIESEAVYVYNRKTGQYHVHAHITCPYAVNAITGELLKTSEIL